MRFWVRGASARRGGYVRNQGNGGGMAAGLEEEKV